MNHRLERRILRRQGRRRLLRDLGKRSSQSPGGLRYQMVAIHDRRLLREGGVSVKSTHSTEPWNGLRLVIEGEREN